MMEERDITLREYRRLKGSPVHNYDVSNSYGVYDYYKYYRHNRPRAKSYYKMNEHQYYKLIRAVNEYLVELLFKNKIVEFPDRLGQLVIQKRNTTVTFKDGKLRTNRPVNWDATIRLWFEDPEAEKNKTVVRWDTDHLTTIVYKKSNTLFRNKPFYEFQVLRRLKQRLGSLINEGGLETPFFVDYTVDSIKSLYHD